MSQAQDTLIDRTFDGRYRIVRRLGAGGMANVYLAEDRELGRRVAIKILNDRYASDDLFVERFRREAKSAAALSHPNIVSIYDRGEAEGTYYIAMEVIEGRSLKELIRASGRLRPAQAIAYARQILAALRFAHRNGIVHRDIKPHNILVGAEERLKVTDFGIARAGVSQMTETGSIMGTAQYLSPEQARGGDVGAPADLYSVGIVIYEMLTGEVPFTGDSPVEIAMKHLNETPRPPSQGAPGIPADLDRVVLRALAKDPRERYQTAEEFDSDLARIEAGLPVARETAQAATVVLAGASAPGAPTQVLPGTTPPPGVGVPPGGRRPPPYDPYDRPPRRRRSFLPWIAVAILLAAFAVAGWYVYQQINERLVEAENVAVPLVEGVTEAKAVELIEEAELVANVERQADEEVPEGQVIDQDPEAGTKVDKGETVTIVVSTGVPQVEVPAVANLPVAEAVQMLADAGLRAETREVFSDRVEAGVVISQDPKPGEQVDRGSVVTLRVSKGENLVDVPNVIGTDQATAVQILEEAGFVVDAVEVNADADPGIVVGQDPAGGQAPKGATVTIQVSVGPQLVGVPGVIGQAEGDAIATLEAQGFSVNVQELTANSPAEDGIVLDQDPGQGAELEPGSTVTIFVGRFTEPVPPADAVTTTEA